MLYTFSVWGAVLRRLQCITQSGRALGVVLVCVGALCAACEQAPVFPAGVIALVNGQTITVRQVETHHDASGAALIIAQSPSVEALQAQYGQSLAELIVLTLVEQELEERGLAVTAAEVAATEARVRAEYEPGVFEAMLQEEYIEINAWRDLLKKRLALQRLHELVLRPLFTVTVPEIEATYERERAFFEQPARSRFLLVSGEKDLVSLARTAYLENKDVPLTESEGLRVEELTLAESRMPPAWLRQIKGRPVGRVSPLFEDENVTHFCVLLERILSKTLSIIDVYPMLEQSVVAEKIEAFFETWLTKRLEASRVLLSSRVGLGAPSSESERRAKP